MLSLNFYIMGENMNNQKHFCCPQCGNRNLQITTQTDVTTTGKGYSAGKGCLGYFLLGPIGLLCGACGSGQKTTVKDTKRWACSNCGNNFEAPDDIKARAKELSAVNKIFIGLLVFGLVTIVPLLVFVGSQGEEIPPVLLLMLIVLGLLMALVPIFNMSAVKKLKTEAYTLESSMQRFAGYNTYQGYPVQTGYVQAVQRVPVVYTWTCSCGSVNSTESKFCPVCGRGNPYNG